MGRLSLTDEACVALTPTQWPNKVHRPGPPQPPQALDHDCMAAPNPARVADCKPTPLTRSHVIESDTLQDGGPKSR